MDEEIKKALIEALKYIKGGSPNYSYLEIIKLIEDALK